MKTPDEIKKGLEHCINGTSCRGCPYCEECATASDCNPMQKDLQEYIQQLESGLLTQAGVIATMRERNEQLESDKQQLEGLLTHMNQLRDAAAGRALNMEERARQLEAERDALMKDLNGACWACKLANVSNGMCVTSGDCAWEWRAYRRRDEHEQ